MQRNQVATPGKREEFTVRNLLAAMLSLAVIGLLLGCSQSVSPIPETSEVDKASADDTADQTEPEVSEEPILDFATLRMAIVDETTDGIPKEFNVWVRGTGDWFYALETLIEQAGPFPVEEPTSFYIYPQGRDSTEIEVDVLVPADVIPDSVKSMIRITVYDEEVKVNGLAIAGLEAKYPR